MRKIPAALAVLAVAALSACVGNDSDPAAVNESSTAVNNSSGFDDDYTSAVSDFTVEFDDGGAEIVRYNGAGGDVVIPGEINGMRVAGIESRAFENCAELTSVTIPGSVKDIGDDAFANCVNLSSVTIEYGMREIDEYAFSGCTALTRLDIPESVTKIERFAFSGCPNLTVFFHDIAYSGEDIFRIYNED